MTEYRWERKNPNCQYAVVNKKGDFCAVHRNRRDAIRLWLSGYTPGALYSEWSYWEKSGFTTEKIIMFKAVE